MSERDKKLLVYLGSLIILAAAYFLVGSPYMTKIEELESQKGSIQSELNEKQRAIDMQGEYAEKIESSKNSIRDIVERFPADNPQEKSIMFIYDTEKEIQIKIPQVNFSEATDSAIGEISMSEEEAAAEQQAVDVAEEGNDESGIVAVEAEEQTEIDGIQGLMGKVTQLGINYSTNYDSFKDFIKYIRDYNERMVITSMDVVYEEGKVSGTMILTQYALTGPGRVLEEVKTGKEENLGKKNIFKKSGSSSYDILDTEENDLEYSSEDGEESQSGKYDYTIIVDAQTDNSDAITIGRASGDAEGESYLTGKKNGTADVYFTVSGEAGEYTAKYSVDGKDLEDESFEKGEHEFIRVKVSSNIRLSDDDKVSASLHITNDSDLKLVVSVLGDDMDNPRVNIVEKNGKIIVN